MNTILWRNCSAKNGQFQEVQAEIQSLRLSIASRLRNACFIRAIRVIRG
jgi:hypothetical protein